MIKVLSMETSATFASENMKKSQPDKNMVTVFCGGGGGGTSGGTGGGGGGGGGSC